MRFFFNRIEVGVASAVDATRWASLGRPRDLAPKQIIALGFEDKQIAVHLGISRRTVRTHLERLFSDLEVHSRAAAVALWMTAGRP